MEPITTTPEATPLASFMPEKRAGHDPENPQWDKVAAPEVRGNLPPILGDMIDNATAYYYDPAALLPLYRVMNGKERGVSKYRGTNKDGSMRKSRSEAREADVLVMVAIILHLDVVSLRVGTPIHGNGFIHRSCRELAARVSLLDPKTQKPNRRFQRAFKRLQEAGFLNVTRIATKGDDGRITQSNAVKSVTEDFVVLLLGGTAADRAKLRRQRDNQSKKQAPKRAPTPSHRKQQERDDLGAKMDEANRVNDSIKEIGKETGFKMAPAEYKAAYEAAKAVRGAELRAQGLHFGQVVAEMRNFPPMGAWKP